MLIKLLDKMITYLTAIAYVILLVNFYYLGQTELLYKSILVPAISFIVVSLYRLLNHTKRPYEVYGFTPIIEKDTKEKSFPSRHIFSIYMMAMVFTQYSIELGVMFMLFGLLLAIIRVCGGVHFIKDVVSGALIGVICGLLGLYVIL